LVTLEKGSRAGRFTAMLNDKPVEFEVVETPGSSISLRIGGEGVTFQRGMAKLRPAALETRQPEDLSSSLVAPMPGRVVSVLAKAGQHVKSGDPLIVLESMKMESVLRSGRDTKVREVAVRDGDTVKRGQLLVSYGD
ncbi:MAG: acetyl-CoA carboxylase biotin carboxyl carrier protein subunit, partial [Nitrososphaerales archaeon]|nr:acetyl-CoA carboxylase biotin carboxyl carrier protein subunit [Nitrososphaerales archaeon]